MKFRLAGLTVVCALGACTFVLSAQTVPEVLRPQATIPFITGAASAASGISIASDVPGHVGAAPGSWISIYGTGFTVLNRGWQDSDFLDGRLPPQIEFVSVTVNARPTWISYISPNQLNVLLPPDDLTTGSVAVQVKISLLQSNFFYVDKVALQPALFPFSSKYPAAVHNATGIYAGPTGLLEGVTTTPAKPGEVIQLFGTGFGASNPPVTPGILLSAAIPMAQTVTARVGGVSANVAGFLVAQGVYQFNLTVPDVANGDQPLSLTVGGISTQSGMFLNVAK